MAMTPPNVPPADAALLYDIANAAMDDFADRGDGIRVIALTESAAARLRALAEVIGDWEQRCDECRGPHYVDASLPSETWNQIAAPHEMLCPVCIDKRLVAKGLTADAQFYFAGKALRSINVRRTVIGRSPLLVEDDGPRSSGDTAASDSATAPPRDGDGWVDYSNYTER